MHPIAYRQERTLARPAEMVGRGLVTGVRTRLRLLPAEPHTGLRFTRVDQAHGTTLPARVEYVTNTKRRTTLGPAESGVTLVEHLLAALKGLRVDNCWIQIDGMEPPGVDGSALPFADLIKNAGIVTQSARHVIWAVDSPVIARDHSATITLHPPEANRPLEFRLTYILDYGQNAPIARQAFTTVLTPETFHRDIAGCRTFVLEQEAHQLRLQGIGTHLSTSDLLVFGQRGLIDNRLRVADEPARHKLLDIVGDLALSGLDWAGHLVAYRSGHALNVELARMLAQRVAQCNATRVLSEPERPGFTRSRRQLRAVS